MKNAMFFPAFFLAAASFGQGELRYEFTEPHMGTTFKIILFAPGDSLAQAAANAAFQRVAALEQILSDYREDSEVSRLSASAGSSEWVPLSEDLHRVLRTARQVSRRSDGAFDPTTGALTKLWRRAFRQQQFPAAAEIEQAKATVGWRFLEVKSKKVNGAQRYPALASREGKSGGRAGFARLKNAGTALDLGGVGKGYAVDEAMQVLRQHGISSALIAGGGDLLASDPPPGTTSWSVERFVFKNGELATEPMLLANRAISTSGDTYRYLEWQGKRYSHIIDPRTGLGLTTRQLVSVMAPTSTEADAWATAWSVKADERLILRLRKKGWEVWISSEK